VPNYLDRIIYHEIVHQFLRRDINHHNTGGIMDPFTALFIADTEDNPNVCDLNRVQINCIQNWPKPRSTRGW